MDEKVLVTKAYAQGILRSALKGIQDASDQSGVSLHRSKLLDISVDIAKVIDALTDEIRLELEGSKRLKNWRG